MNSKRKSIIERIACLENAIIKAQEYLELGAHADWRGFRPLFKQKIRDGKAMPPHKDWVKNVFLPRQEKALHIAYKKLDRID